MFSVGPTVKLEMGLALQDDHAQAQKNPKYVLVGVNDAVAIPHSDARVNHRRPNLAWTEAEERVMDLSEKPGEHQLVPVRVVSIYVN